MRMGVVPDLDEVLAEAGPFATQLGLGSVAGYCAGVALRTAGAAGLDLARGARQRAVLRAAMLVAIYEVEVAERRSKEATQAKDGTVADLQALPREEQIARIASLPEAQQEPLINATLSLSLLITFSCLFCIFRAAVAAPSPVSRC